jgi:hypothetical protein
MCTPFEDTKGVIRNAVNRKGTDNAMDKRKGTDNDLHNTSHKTTDRAKGGNNSLL